MSQFDRKFILHIGQHKTGTTSIQGALAAGLLEVEGCTPLYPGAFNHNYLVRHFTVFRTESRILNPDGQMPNLEQIKTMLAERDYRYAIISGERFSGSDPALVADIMRTFILPHVQDHSVLCYVRPHAARTLSEFVERIKVGSYAGASLARFNTSGPAFGRFRLAPKIMAWDTVFGEKFRALPYHRDFFKDGDVLNDFSAHAFPGRVVSHRGRVSSNESITLEALVLLRFIHACLQVDHPGLHHQLGWSVTTPAVSRQESNETPNSSDHPGRGVMKIINGLAALISQAQGNRKTKVALDRQTAEDIRSLYMEDAEFLDTTIFAATPLMKSELDRAVETSIDRAQSMEASDYHAPETLREIRALVKAFRVAIGGKPGFWSEYLLRRRIDAGVSA